MAEKIPNCEWIKGKQAPCRYPEMMAVEPESSTQQTVISLRCIACLFGWHLELSELKERE